MASTALPEFGTQLANVRRLTASGQSHQAKPAKLLTAIEATIGASLPGSQLPYPATAYFTALLQCLEKACSDEIAEGETDEEMAETEKMNGGALIPATLYLLAIVVPETPAQVVLSKLSPLLENLLPLYDTALPHPPALRSILQITTAVTLFATPQLLTSSPLLRRSWSYLLELNLDPRPKVRHLAQEGVRKVLTTPIPPRMTPGAHPYLPRSREWVTSALDEELKGGNSKGKKARFTDAEDSEGKKAIWVVQGLRGWVAVWGDEQLSQLSSLLLSLPPHPHLTSQVYSLLAHLLTPPPADSSSAKPAVLVNLPTIIDSLLSSVPDLSSPDVPAYLSALRNALIKMALQDPANLPAYLPRAFKLMFNDMLLAQGASTAVLNAAADAISSGVVRFCITDEAILSTISYMRHGSHLPGARKKQKTPFLTRLLGAVTEALDAHALRMPYLLTILAALVSRLRIRVQSGTNDPKIDEAGTAPTAAEELLLPLIAEVGDLRNNKTFEAKDKVDDVVGMAIEVIGVEGVLKSLPLNIEPDSTGKVQQPGRAHLLPLIRSRTTNDSLAYFANYFRPMSERLFERKVAAEDAGRDNEAKIWEVLVSQIWDCLPGFCEMPRDLKEGLSGPFLSLLTNLLYTQPLLLPPLLRSLLQLIASTQQLINSATEPAQLRKQFGLDQDAARANLEVLRGLAKDMVSVLLNVFSKMPREQRGMVGDVIGAWVSVMTEADMIETYNTVTSHLSANLGSSSTPAPGASPISHTMLDLLIVFVPHLPAAQSASLFAATATSDLLEHSDATVQKKAYRVLKRLLEAGKIGEAAKGAKLESFVEQLNAVAAGVGPGAQRDRLQLLSTLVDALPRDCLHFIPELLSEAVLGTKEVNEKARDAGFDLLVVMGNKMAAGGEVKQAAVEADDDDEDSGMAAKTVAASAEEYITMVAAGLTGETPHMISASINALSRLLFEFKDDISNDLISDLVATIVVFVGSKNREIVKSALGFVKVAVVALPVDAVEPHLNTLVPALLGWVHDHKNHFKSKTVHIFERMIRKFGFDAVYKQAPEGGERKVLDNIRKRKERAKKKKAAGGDDDDEMDGAKKVRTSTGNAFDDILYNSDSELESDGEDNGGAASASARSVKPLSKRQQKRAAAAAAEAAFIRADGDEPMDLLSRSIAGGVTHADPSQSRKRKPGQDAAHFKTDKSGRMIIKDENAGGAEGGDEPMGADAAAGAGNAYLSAMSGTDGAMRTAAGLKFNKNTKRSRAEEREAESMLDLDELMGDRPKKAPKKKAAGPVPKLGEEFRHKRAGGDIKREGGPDPYSYVPIGQAAQRKGAKGQQRVNLTNKKKGSRA